MGAVSPAHKNAVLRVAKIGKGHGQPNSDARQRRRENNRGNVCDHPMAVLFRALTPSLVLRQISRDLAATNMSNIVGVFIGNRCWRSRNGARAEFHYAIFAVRHHWSLDGHESKSELPIVLARRSKVSWKKKVFL